MTRLKKLREALATVGVDSLYDDVIHSLNEDEAAFTKNRFCSLLDKYAHLKETVLVRFNTLLQASKTFQQRDKLTQKYLEEVDLLEKDFSSKYGFASVEEIKIRESMVQAGMPYATQTSQETWIQIHKEFEALLIINEAFKEIDRKIAEIQKTFKHSFIF